MRRAWKLATSSRTTMAILVLLAGLLFLNVAIPQVAVVGPAAVAELAARGPLLRFLLVTLRLSELSTSAVFLGTLGAFFLNLALVLVDRARVTAQRLRYVPPTEAQVRAMAGASTALTFARPPGFGEGRAAAVLERLGYRTTRAGPSALWGIRHRTAVLGFPLFHASFFFLCAGGLALYYTRHVTMVTAAEGQAFESTGGKVVRASPAGLPPGQSFLLERVDVRLEDGKPLQLGALVRPLEGGEAQQAWVNHPAEWGALSLLVERAGVAPVLWLQDERGYTLDKVAVLAIARDGANVQTPLGDGELAAEVVPIPVGPEFPEREALATVPINLKVRRGEQTLFAGEVVPGQFIRVGRYVLKLEEVRYWALLRTVSERGGLWLVVGFLLAVAGLTWRMVWFRREVGVCWDEQHVWLVCRSEYFPRQFREELEMLQGLLASPQD